MANLQYGQNSRHFIHSSHLALLLGTHTLTMGVIENICYCKTMRPDLGLFRVNPCLQIYG